MILNIKPLNQCLDQIIERGKKIKGVGRDGQIASDFLSCQITGKLTFRYSLDACIELPALAFPEQVIHKMSSQLGFKFFFFLLVFHKDIWMRWGDMRHPNKSRAS